MSVTQQRIVNPPELILFGLWVLITFLLGLTAWLLEGGARVVILDMLHWTSAFALSLALAWRGMRLAATHDADVLFWLVLGAGLMLVGQLVWNLQVLAGWNPFPSLADVLFLAVGPLWMIGLMRALKLHLPADRFHSAMLDICGMVFALLALVLTLYVPHGEEISLIALLVLVFYPVSFLSAAFFALLMIPGMALRMAPAHLLLMVGITAYGLTWMQWNLMVLDGQLQAGMLFNMAFGVSALLLGLGARFWRIEVRQEPGYLNACERVMNHVPLLAMLLALALLFHFFYALTETGFERGIIFVCCLLTLLLVGVRQTHMLEVLERLRQAETAILQNQEQMFRLAHYDALTHLPNRLFFENQMEHALQMAARRHDRVAFMLVDLDHFKQINDIYGHRTGDMLLCEASARISRSLDDRCTLARMSGDEFMVMVEQCRSRTEVAQLAEGILQGFSKPCLESGREPHFVTASIGISLYPDDASTVMELVRNADLALNQVKSSNRNSYCFYLQEYTLIARKRLELSTLLHRALPEGQFHVLYQPQMDAAGRLVGAEALLRWTVHGQPVSPEDFIPLAESTGLIVPIGEWIFRSVCRQLRQWRQGGVEIGAVSINISAVQLRRPELARQLLDIAREEGTSPDTIMLEVTESEMLDDEVIPTVVALREAGFGLSIDDFGTGQSSLVKLKKLPAGELKIDKAFVRDIAHDEGDRQICAMILALSHALGLTVVAEGVETPEQFRLLRGMGCHRFQGWLFSPAVEADALVMAIPGLMAGLPGNDAGNTPITDGAASCDTV
ncbi:putative bifunctional diguanylate cyclase/phosphodiesterase [Ectothiorhodospira shaposhnikovii]|uniref:putative bifunctional diguanylate cyclase/phosphodiesterase n=1 Tax=Ectothiorhodospira shaposhnikovii TaxID=1054 RepID=UPI001EE882B2|nr:EAL domain-containing protein [Ectothiorhodospira shaposhnikovii]MCG5513867.1 EAL domain-containing protein [Ectothiorhodospira shaposhnikovii]